MGIIKGVLREELENSLQIKKGYERELRKLPQGAITIRKIRGHEYAYLAKRKGDKVQFTYMGKLNMEEFERYKKAKETRAQYRKLLSLAKKQIRYLRGTLRGKESI